MVSRPGAPSLGAPECRQPRGHGKPSRGLALGVIAALAPRYP